MLGKIYFLLVRIKIKHMELAIIRRESAGMGESPVPLLALLCMHAAAAQRWIVRGFVHASRVYTHVARTYTCPMSHCAHRTHACTGGSVTNESETLTKFEVMDGAPVRGAY